MTTGDNAKKVMVLAPSLNAREFEWEGSGKGYIKEKGKEQ